MKSSCYTRRMEHRKYKTPHNYTVYLDLEESYKMVARVLGTYETFKFKLLSNLLLENMTFLDVGSCKGDFALFAATLINKGRIYAFEPEPTNFKWIVRSIQENQFANITAINAALSDSTSTAILHLGKESGWHTLNEEQLQPTQTQDSSQCLVYTKQLDNMNLKNLHLMKVDVEGSEHRVFEGAKETIAEYRPIILLELHAHLGADIASINEMFSKLNYTFALTKNPTVKIDALPTDPKSLDYDVILWP